MTELVTLLVGIGRLPPLLAVKSEDVVPIDKFVNVRLPVAETLLSDMLLIDSGGTVTFDDTVAGGESVFDPSLAPVLLVTVGLDVLFGNIVNPSEDVVGFAPGMVELIGTVVAGTDVRDTLDNVPTGSDPELRLPLAEKLLAEKPVVTAKEVDTLGNVKEVPETELEIPLEDRPSEAELPVRLGTVPVGAVPANPLEGTGGPEEASPFVAVLPIELVPGTEFVNG